MRKPPKRSTLALAALSMLCQEPMHPYRMQRLIKERGKDEVIDVTQRASLYQTIARLERDGLLSKQQVTRDEKRPERTVYEITEAGRAITLTWMRECLSQLAPEYPQFPAAVSMLAFVTPQDALRQLDLRQQALHAEIKRIDIGLQQASRVPRLFLLEFEYLRAMRLTELTWVTSGVAELLSGKITWNEAWLRKIAAEFEVADE
jgi:DNA-binding PadR family transcriptional regulator